MRNIFITIGLVFLLTGLFWPWLVKLQIGRLPGDIVINRHGFKLYIPITTMLLVSLIASLISWLLRK